MNENEMTLLSVLHAEQCISSMNNVVMSLYYCQYEIRFVFQRRRGKNTRCIYLIRIKHSFWLR